MTLPKLEQFDNSQAFLATWSHELTHATGHSSRLSRPYGIVKSSKAYAREELVAELGAFLICNRLKINSDTQNHAAYLQSWANVLKESPNVLFKVLSDATKAANLICGPEVTEEKS